MRFSEVDSEYGDSKHWMSLRRFSIAVGHGASNAHPRPMRPCKGRFPLITYITNPEVM